MERSGQLARAGGRKSNLSYHNYAHNMRGPRLIINEHLVTDETREEPEKGTTYFFCSSANASEKRLLLLAGGRRRNSSHRRIILLAVERCGEERSRMRRRNTRHWWYWWYCVVFRKRQRSGGEGGRFDDFLRTVRLKELLRGEKDRVVEEERERTRGLQSESDAEQSPKDARHAEKETHDNNELPRGRKPLTLDRICLRRARNAGLVLPAVLDFPFLRGKQGSDRS